MIHFSDYWKRLHEMQKKEKEHSDLIKKGVLKLNSLLSYIFVSNKKKQEYLLPDILKSQSLKTESNDQPDQEVQKM